MKNKYTTTLICNISELEKIEKEWNKLFVKANEKSPFISYDWMLSWISAYQQGEKLFVCLIYDRNEIVAICPFVFRRYFCFNILEFIASERSDYLDFLMVDRKCIPIVIEVLKKYQKKWDIICLRNLWWNRNKRKEYEIEITNHKLSFEKRIYTHSPYLSIECNWESYFKKRGKNFKKRVKKKEKRIKNQNDIEIVKEKSFFFFRL